METKRKSNLDIVYFLRAKELQLIDRQYQLIMEDCFNQAEIEKVQERLDYLYECREKIFDIISYEQKFDKQINKLLNILEDL